MEIRLLLGRGHFRRQDAGNFLWPGITTDDTDKKLMIREICTLRDAPLSIRQSA